MIYILRRRLLAQAGKAQPRGQPFAVALERLPIHKHGQPILEAEIKGFRLSSLLLQRTRHAGKAEFAQTLCRGMCQHL